MSTAAKARVATLICLLYIVWPAVHRVVVGTYHTNAWQLGGFAMYATPPARTQVSIFEKQGGGRTPYRGSLPDALARKKGLYELRRSILGLLLPPRSLATAYFEARPNVNHIEVVIGREMLDASTARMQRREYVYSYDRPGHSGTPPE